MSIWHASADDQLAGLFGVQSCKLCNIDMGHLQPGRSSGTTSATAESQFSTWMTCAHQYESTSQATSAFFCAVKRIVIQRNCEHCHHETNMPGGPTSIDTASVGVMAMQVKAFLQPKCIHKCLSGIANNVIKDAVSDGNLHGSFTAGGPFLYSPQVLHTPLVKVR